MSEFIDSLSPQYRQVIAREFLEMAIPYLMDDEDKYVRCAVYQLSSYMKDSGKCNYTRLREVLFDLLDHMGEER